MNGMGAMMNCFGCGEADEKMNGEIQQNAEGYGVPDKTIKFAKEVLDDFRKNVGKYRAETGGMLGSTTDPERIDVCYFDIHSRNTPGTFYYDVESMSEVFREWKKLGYITNGIYHSHPLGCIRPSYHDISSALLHLRFFDLDYFYLPVIQNDRRGFYTMYFYVVRKKEEVLEVNLDYVIKAHEKSYTYAPFKEWKQEYSIMELDAYREGVDRQEACEREKRKREDEKMGKNNKNTDPYFKKVKSLYPQHVLDKVIISVGTGGARSALTNFARCGFNNFILIEADTVGESNIATQAVHISEMGRKKVDVIKEEILDINPNAAVICVDRFLDDTMSDEEFKGYMDLFPGKKPTDYLILGCTDNFEAQKRSSILALKYGSPYLAAMMYKSGAAAELIFVYPGVTESCPRCLLGSRFEKYENGFENDVDSSACPIFATERMNALKGYIALMLLMYHEAPGNIYNDMLDSVKNRNFVQIRLTPNVKDVLGIEVFDRAFEGAQRYTFMDETVWIPQKPDHPSNGYDTCKLCGGTGHLEHLYMKWDDTRNIESGNPPLQSGEESLL
jgi:proteasome lid subunit RPN8/RPN11